MVPGGLWHIRPKECQSARRRAGIGPPWLCRDVGIVGPLSGVPFFAVSFCCGSWLCENADVLRRRRITFSSARCSFLLARGSPLGTHRCSDAQISKTLRFLHFWRAAHDLPFVLLCVEPRVIWRRVGIGF